MFPDSNKMRGDLLFDNCQTPKPLFCRESRCIRENVRRFSLKYAIETQTLCIAEIKDWMLILRLIF